MYPGTVRQTHWLDPFIRDRRCDRWMRGKDMLKRSFSPFMFSASLVQLGTTRNYIAVEEKSLGFVLVYELVCTELHGSGSFVKRVDPFCALNRHDCVLQLGCHSVCPHCKHLDTFEFLCMVQVKRSIALHSRTLKSRGINLI